MQNTFWIDGGLLLLGFALLTVGADVLTTGASALAKRFGLSPLVIGLTIIALGTSAPEISVSIIAALKGNSGIALGNALGSNIANIGLVLGLTVLIRPLTIASGLVKREFPILFTVMLLTLTVMLDGYLGVADGIVLLIALLMLMIIMVFLAKTSTRTEPLLMELEQELSTEVSLVKIIVFLILGFILLPLASYLLVLSASTIARHFGISDLVIGLTIVAIGTSLPEVATSIAAALKGESDLALGNILGSNMFNLLAVLPFAGLIDPKALPHHALGRDMLVMFIITVVLLLMSYGRREKTLPRWYGGVLLGCYVGYLFGVMSFS